MDFEEELRRALARREPSPDFTRQVLAKVAAQTPSRQRHPWPWAAIAAAVLVLASTAVYQRHERETQGEAAKQKLLVALHIAGTKLQQTQQAVQQVESFEVNQ